MNHGRPSKKQQIDIQNKIENYFLDGYSARKTSKLVDVNVKTAQEHYGKLLVKYKNVVQSEPGFEKRVLEDRIKTVLLLENRIDELLLLSNNYQTKLENLQLTNKTFKIYKFLSDAIIRINSDLVNIRAMMSNNALIPSESELFSMQKEALSN